MTTDHASPPIATSRAGGSTSPAWRARTELDLAAQQLQAIARFNDARRTAVTAAGAASRSREMRMDDGVVKTEERPSHVQHVRFEYQYDAHGNWTERVVSQRLEPNADERPSNIERRTISYYGR